MKKGKIIITESERQADLIKRQQIIIESFGKEFNKIKRIDEFELHEGDENQKIDKLKSILDGIGLEGHHEVIVMDFVSRDGSDDGERAFRDAEHKINQLSGKEENSTLDYLITVHKYKDSSDVTVQLTKKYDKSDVRFEILDKIEQAMGTGRIGHLYYTTELPFTHITHNGEPMNEQDPEGGPEFKVGDTIVNTGNDGTYYDMDGTQGWVERPWGIQGEIIDIKDGFYMVKLDDHIKWVDFIKVKVGESYYKSVDRTPNFPERDGPMYEENGGMNEQDPVGDGFGAEYEDDDDRFIKGVIGSVIAEPKESLNDYDYNSSDDTLYLQFTYDDEQYGLEGYMELLFSVDDIQAGYYEPATFHDPAEGESTSFELSLNSIRIVRNNYEGERREELLTTNIDLIKNHYMDIWYGTHLEEWLSEEIDKSMGDY